MPFGEALYGRTQAGVCPACPAPESSIRPSRLVKDMPLCCCWTQESIMSLPDAGCHKGTQQPDSVLAELNECKRARSPGITAGTGGLWQSVSACKTAVQLLLLRHMDASLRCHNTRWLDSGLTAPGGGSAGLVHLTLHQTREACRTHRWSRGCCPATAGSQAVQQQQQAAAS